MARISVVVSGFATLDYVVRAEGVFTGQGTLTMRQGGADAWPRAGGAALYAGLALARAGVTTAPLTWVGDDGDGWSYRRVCLEGGLSLDGVAVAQGASSTRCLLIYNADGTYGCLLRPGPTALSPAQVALAARADWLAVSAGPAKIAHALLDALAPTTRLAWIAKFDPACFPPDLVARLAGRADAIFCNGDERAWLEAGRKGSRPPGQILFETRGAAGVVVEGADGVARHPAEPVAVDDATGAGDTFAGAALAVLARGGGADTAARAGLDAAQALLAARAGR
jgi:ribokinase